MSQISADIPLRKSDGRLHVVSWMLLLLISVIVAVVCFLVATMWIGSRCIVIVMDDPVRLTEDLAVTVSKDAMQRAGLNNAKLQPDTYNGQDYFARNISNPDRGYVIWRWIDDRDAGYTVYIERTGKSVKCEIARNK